MGNITLFTIGSGGKTAQQFFGLLKKHGVKLLVDVRLKNTSHLAGFTKKQDLPYFLREICGIPYLHAPLLSPDEKTLAGYRKKEITWSEYEKAFNGLLIKRRAENLIPPGGLDGGCLLCSEPLSDFCHRRLAAEYLASKIPGIAIVHL